MSGITWNDPVLEACEGAVCPCSHEVLDHEWDGCEDCGAECSRSPVRALLDSGLVVSMLLVDDLEYRARA